MLRKKQPSEPIAIVGSSCRFAGGASSPSRLWDVLAHPTDLCRKVPGSRFNIDGFYHADGEYHGTTNSPNAYWLDQDHRVFDAAFFNVTPKEAEAMDPQQRMLLEVVYEALESAGYSLQQYAGQDVAVYAGVMTADYDTLSQRDDLTTSRYYATGNARSMISSRVSYFFDFRGPSMTVDTACSSSLVALHQAVLSLRAGESSVACVAGANLMMTPEHFIVESSLHMLSPSGRCRMWDAGADGYARGEGVAALFLKPLGRALADGDCIQAIVRETGVNSDGRTKGITVPSADAQAALIRSTYLRAGLDPTDPRDRCQYFEAHGTGTRAGDPVEATAIHDAFFGGEDAVDPGRKLLVGSVKTVIGHTEGAAGLAGVLKVAQAMRHGAIPPNLHLDRLSPSVRPFYSCLEIPTVLKSWPPAAAGQPLRASVNSFGFGGTNSHAIIERYEPSIHNRAAEHFNPELEIPQRRLRVPFVPGAFPVRLPLLLSACSQKSLRAVAETYKKQLEENASASVEELAWYLYASRTALPFRLAIACESRADLIRRLEQSTRDSNALATGEIGFRSRGSEGRSPKILGIFTGQGAQWAGMSRGLLQSNHVYRQTIVNLDLALKSCPDPPDWTLQQEIMAEEHVSRIGTAAISQPLCTALQMALINLLRSIGIALACVVGHSSGEIAAAYAAGRLTARDAILIAYYRGMWAHLAGGQDGQGSGGMVAVGLDKTEAEELCRREDLVGRISFAASNSPLNVTLSGDMAAVRQVRSELADQGRFARLLAVDTAYHSTHMDKPAAAYLESLEACDITPTETISGPSWISSVFGDGSAPRLEAPSGTYWRDNMVQPVLFHEALAKALAGSGPFDCALEIGPHPALKGPATQTMKDTLGKAVPYCGLLDRRKEDRVAFAEFLGFMWTRFGPQAVDIGRFVESSSCAELTKSQLEDMPSYPWDHGQAHYRESRISRQYHQRTHPPHELLGVRTRDDNEYELRWRNILRLDKIPWIGHHKFQGQALLPASAYCVMALDAARVLLDGREASVIELEELEFLGGITLEPDSHGVEVLFALSVLPQPKAQPKAQQQLSIEATFTVTSAVADGRSSMRKNFTGRLRILLGKPDPGTLPPRPPCHPETLPVSVDAFYSMMGELGLVYSGPFRALQTIERRYNFTAATLARVHADDTTGLAISPAMMDTCLQSCFTTFSSPGDRALWTPFLPKTMRKVRFNMAMCCRKMPQKGVTVEAHLTNFNPISMDSAAGITGDISVFNQNGEMEFQVEGLTVGSFASTRPEEDYELYLHTVMDLDPEDEIVSAAHTEDARSDRVLAESCERAAASYLLPTPPSSPIRAEFAEPGSPSTAPTASGWPGETYEKHREFVSCSPPSSTVEFIQSLGKAAPGALSGMLASIILEAQQLSRFQGHLSRVTRQLAHRYSRMNIFDLTDPEYDLTDHILAGLGPSFASYIAAWGGNKNHSQLGRSRSQQKKVAIKELDLGQDLDSQLSSPRKFDLAVLSASIIQKEDTSRVLRQVKHLLKRGGFLFLIHIPMSPLHSRLRRHAGLKSDDSSLHTPPDWPDVLEECGFVQSARNSNQSFPAGFFLTVRQSECAFKERLRASPLQQPAGAILTEKLLVIGARQQATAELAAGVRSRLAPYCGPIHLARCWEDADAATVGAFTAAVVLADLDEPVLSAMTEHRLDTMKALLKPGMLVLWATHGARAGNPDHAASFGFARTMLAEVPSLALQMLDLDTPGGSAELVADAFARLALQTGPPGDGSVLWTHEPEIHVKEGRRVIPRVLPYQPGNDRVNASRRLVSRSCNTLETAVQLVSTRSAHGTAAFETRLAGLDLAAKPVPGHVVVQVDYSTVVAVSPGPGGSSYICAGRDLHTGDAVIATTRSNASFVSVPAADAYRLVQVSSVPLLLNLLSRFLVSLSVVEQVQHRNVIFFGANKLLLDCAQDVLTQHNISLIACSVRTTSAKVRSGEISVHPHSTARELGAIFPPSGAAVFNFLPDEDPLSKLIIDVLPSNCEYSRGEILLGRGCLGILGASTGRRSRFEKAIQAALEKLPSATTAGPSGLLSVPALLQRSAQLPPFQVIDWKAERMVQHTIKPQISSSTLRPDRTYVLVGLTRDMGQSLCRLFVEQGARNMALASRTPSMNPKWRDELAARGINIVIESLDVTSLDDVMGFRRKIADAMPPVAGVVNGAMVLDDLVFAQMTAESFNRVMRPKTVGSKNLDLAFDGAEMDFFIMTSSFAAIGGHAGQSNYAAANMYMNGLAASRRRRGLVGSVLNIGVIYGLGLLHREKGELYRGLEREGYPPVSERDIHHMFLEAVAAGRPVPGQVADLTTGLCRFRVGGARPLHWHRDPRFSHFTLDDDDDDDDDNTAGEGGVGGHGNANKAGQQSLREALELAATTASGEVVEVLLPAFTRRLEGLLQSPTDSIGGDSSLAELGVDSLVAVEIRAWIWAAVGTDVPVMKILASTSIAKHIAELVMADRKGEDDRA